MKRLCETERSYNVAIFLSYDDYRELSLEHRYNTMCSHNSKKKKNEFYKLKGISTLIARAWKVVLNFKWKLEIQSSQETMSSQYRTIRSQSKSSELSEYVVILQIF